MDRRTGRIAVPWLQTAPVTDLKLGLLLLPVWWVLGVEQFIWIVIGLLALAKVLRSQSWRLRLPPFVVWSLLYLLVQAASALFIVEGMRVVTFARNYGAYVGSTLWVIVLVNRIESLRQARSVLASVAAAMTVASLIGVLGIVGVWRGGFRSPMGYLLPTSIAETTYGGHVAIRSSGGMAWFIGLGDYFRVDSVFLFPTFFALSIVVALPVVFWLMRSATSVRAMLGWGIAALLLLVNLPFTTGRAAVASFFAGGAWLAARRRPFLSLLGVTAAVAVVAVGSVRPDMRRLAGQGIEAAAYARGAGSVTGRGQVYQSTLAGFLERPVLGWGTERDVPGQRYPAGSHSTYLGVLYKHGTVGLVCLLGVLWSGWRATRPALAPRRTLEHSLLLYGRWVWVIVLLNALTDALDLDATTLLLIYTILGTLLCIGSHPGPRMTDRSA